jgi:hypothetical protein
MMDKVRNFREEAIRLIPMLESMENVDEKNRLKTLKQGVFNKLCQFII